MRKLDVDGARAVALIIMPLPYDVAPLVVPDSGITSSFDTAIARRLSMRKLDVDGARQWP